MDVGIYYRYTWTCALESWRIYVGSQGPCVEGRVLDRAWDPSVFDCIVYSRNPCGLRTVIVIPRSCIVRSQGALEGAMPFVG